MNPIELISQDVFDKVRSRFTNLEMGDESGSVTIDPSEARFFDFDFVVEDITLGRVSISINDLGSLKIYYSQGITEDQEDAAKQLWYSFLKEMRFFAMRRKLRFDTRDIAKNNLDKNDFQHLATTQGTKDTDDMTATMNESKWNHKSTKKTSRAVKGRTEVIVRHTEAVDEMYPGARSQPKKIKAIFIQNADGERFKYPFIHTAGAFAMAQHVDHGGVPHDPAGKAIIGISEQISLLGEFRKKIQHQTLHDEATGITERAMSRLIELKSKIEALGKKHHYENWIAEFNEQEPADDGLEMDEVTMEEYKQKFTQTNFQEELSNFFPLLHRIMRETNTVDLEEFVNETEEKCNECGMWESKCKCDHEVKENAFSKFESWAEAIEQGQLTDEQAKELAAVLPQLKLGMEGSEAWTAISDILEIDESDPDAADLKDALKNKADNSDPNQDGAAAEAFRSWVDIKHNEWKNSDAWQENLASLMPDTQQAEPEQPQPEQPPAEVPQDTAPVDQQTEPPAAENDDAGGTGAMLEKSQPKESIAEMIAKTVESFHNRSNKEVAPFRTPENVALDVKKAVEEQYGEIAAERAQQVALEFMERCNAKWQDTHSSNLETDGLARLRELVGNVKKKVEGMSDRGHGVNIISAEGQHSELSTAIERELVKTFKDKWHGGSVSVDRAIQDTIESLWRGHFLNSSQRDAAKEFLDYVADMEQQPEEPHRDHEEDRMGLLGVAEGSELDRIKKLSGLGK
jgi:hypothetical protein